VADTNRTNKLDEPAVLVEVLLQDLELSGRRPYGYASARAESEMLVIRAFSGVRVP